MWKRPSVAAERWLSVTARLDIGRDAWLEERTEGWRSVSWLMRGALWLVGIVAAGLLFGIVDLLHFTRPILWAGALSVIAAELLITTRRMQGGGLEEALFTAGVLAIAFFSTDTPSSSREFGLAFAVSAALLLGAWRLLNPLLAALAAVAFTFAIETSLGGIEGGGNFRTGALWMSALSFLLAAAALAAGGRRWQRPSLDAAFDYIVVILPVCGYAWGRSRLVSASPPGEVFHPLILPTVFAGITLIVGLRRRTHAPIIAAMACLACLAEGLQVVGPWTRELRLIVGGLVLLVACVSVSRWLSTPRRGITSRKPDDDNEALDILQLVSAASLSPPQSHSAASPTVRGGGGGFSGGGADDSY